MAILIALQWVEKIGQEKVLICSDSLSVLASLRSFHSKARQDILYEVLQVTCFHLIHYADDFRYVNWHIKLILLLLRQANNMISYCHITR